VAVDQGACCCCSAFKMALPLFCYSHTHSHTNTNWLTYSYTHVHARTHKHTPVLNGCWSFSMRSGLNLTCWGASRLRTLLLLRACASNLLPFAYPPCCYLRCVQQLSGHSRWLQGRCAAAIPRATALHLMWQGVVVDQCDDSGSRETGHNNNTIHIPRIAYSHMHRNTPQPEHF